MYYYGGGGFGLLVLILDIYCLYLLFTTRGNDTNKLIWFLVIFFLPVIGAILYLLVGRNNSIA